MVEFKGLPGIVDYSGSSEHFSIEVSELDQIVDALIAYTDLTREQATRVLCLFFQDIRTNMLKGEIVDIRGLGRFLISSPLTTGTQKRIHAKFKPKKSLLKRMNDESSR